MAKVSQYWADKDEELREFEGPDQEPDVFTSFAPTFIALAAEAASLALFIAMMAVWAAIGSGA